MAQSGTLTIRNDTNVEAAAASELDADPLMPQIKVLAELGQAGSLRLFVERDAEVYSSPRHLKRLMLLLNDWGYPEISLRLAKTMSYAGAAMPAFTHPLIVAAAASPLLPTMLGGLLIAKYTPGGIAQAATMAITPTNDSSNIAPYPMNRAWLSRRIIFGVVPEEISEWNPLMAPHAIVMKQNGKIFPAKTGAVPSMKRVSGGIKI